jgi:EF-hand domain pair
MAQKYLLVIAVLAIVHSNVMSFAPPTFLPRPYSATSLPSQGLSDSSLSEESSMPLTQKSQRLEITDTASVVAEPHLAPATEQPPKNVMVVPNQQQHHKNNNEGILSPVVLLAKHAIGDKELNKVRAKAISLHSDVIGNFVLGTSDTPLGAEVLKALFKLVDRNRNGTIEKDELEQALASLGFDWLKDKQVTGIFERADADRNGAIDVEEWMEEAPKTLRTNLVKLAKKNGGDLGLLA